MEYTVQWITKHFNELSAKEYHQLLALRTAIFVVEQDCPYQEVDDRDLNSYHIWGTIDGELIAVSRVVSPGTSYREVSIGRVAVSAKYRGSHVARDLMNKSLHCIEDNLGNQSIRISAQQHLQKFYRKFEFKTVSEMYLEDGIPHVEMLRG